MYLVFFIKITLVYFRHGIIDRQTGMRILERQVASGGLLKPPSLHLRSDVSKRTPLRMMHIEKFDNEFGEEKLQVQDAVRMGIIDPVLGGKLMKTEKARNFVQCADGSG